MGWLSGGVYFWPEADIPQRMGIRLEFAATSHSLLTSLLRRNAVSGVGLRDVCVELSCVSEIGLSFGCAPKA
jgi:hypothetical protein